MKTLLLRSSAALAVACAAASSARASDDYRPATVFGHDVSHGGFGAPDFRVSSVAGKIALFAGGRGAWLVDHGLIVGGGGGGILTEPEAPRTSGTQSVFFGYGGVWLGYAFAPGAVVHPVVSALVGAGGAGTHYVNDPQHWAVASTAVFVAEPELDLELNLFEHARLAAGVSYRIVRGVDLPGLTNADLSGVSGVVMLKLGKF